MQNKSHYNIVILNKNLGELFRIQFLQKVHETGTFWFLELSSFFKTPLTHKFLAVFYQKLNVCLCISLFHLSVPKSSLFHKKGAKMSRIICLSSNWGNTRQTVSK